MKTQEEIVNVQNGTLIYNVYFNTVSYKLLTQEQYLMIVNKIEEMVESFND